MNSINFAGLDIGRTTSGTYLQAMVWLGEGDVHGCRSLWYLVPHGFGCENEGSADWCLFSDCKLIIS